MRSHDWVSTVHTNWGEKGKLIQEIYNLQTRLTSSNHLFKRKVRTKST